MQFFGSILRGAFDQQSTADIWAGIRNAADNAGVNLADLGIGGADVSQLRGIAGSIVRSSQVFATLSPDLALPTDAIAEAPWSQDIIQQALSPMYTVRFTLVGTNPDGTTFSDWRSYRTSDLPGTIGGVNDLATDVAQSQAERYNVGFVGVTGIHVLVGA